MLPGVLGDAWEPMVVPFQILVVVGMVHALLAIVREFLLGAGGVAFCVRVEAVWLVGTVAALVAGTALAGIAGAALAHLVLVVPLAVAYALRGAPRIGLRWQDLWRSVAPIAAVVGAQAAGACRDGRRGAGGRWRRPTARWSRERRRRGRSRCWRHGASCAARAARGRRS